MAPKKTTKAIAKDATESTEVTEQVPQTVSSPVNADVNVNEDSQNTEGTGDKFASIIETLQTFQNQLKDILTQVKSLQKEHVKLQKQKGKKVTKKQQSSETASKRQPSGFAKPTKLSAELCEFLGVPLDTMLARTEVTRILNEYIKKNNLQDPNDRRKIVPDDKLKKILTLTEGVPLSYFSLQSSIKNHFIKV